jgi:hypothetical protein
LRTNNAASLEDGPPRDFMTPDNRVLAGRARAGRTGV